MWIFTWECVVWTLKFRWKVVVFSLCFPLITCLGIRVFEASSHQTMLLKICRFWATFPSLRIIWVVLRRVNMKCAISAINWQFLRIWIFPWVLTALDVQLVVSVLKFKWLQWKRVPFIETRQLCQSFKCPAVDEETGNSFGAPPLERRTKIRMTSV